MLDESRMKDGREKLLALCREMLCDSSRKMLKKSSIWITPSSELMRRTPNDASGGRCCQKMPKTKISQSLLSERVSLRCLVNMTAIPKILQAKIDPPS